MGWWRPTSWRAVFIGSALSLRLLARGDEVVGIDNHNNYYDPALKEARLARHADHPHYTHIRIDLEDRAGIAELFRSQRPQRVVNLAAQAGVRYSIENPLAYIDTNLLGFGHILEGCRHNGVEHLVYKVVVRVLDRPAAPDPDWNGANPDPGTSSAPWRVYNIGNNNPVELKDYVAALQAAPASRRSST